MLHIGKHKIQAAAGTKGAILFGEVAGSKYFTAKKNRNKNQGRKKCNMGIFKNAIAYFPEYKSLQQYKQHYPVNYCVFAMSTG